MNLPKYILSACEKGQIKRFDPSKVEAVDPEGETFAIHYKNDDEVSKRRAEELVCKIEGFANRHCCGGTIGRSDWLWFQSDNGKEPYRQELAQKVPFIKFSLRGDVAYELSMVVPLTKVSDPLEVTRSDTAFGGVKGCFLLRNKLIYLSKTGEVDMRGRRILYSRSDHDGYRWYTSWFHDEVANAMSAEEKSAVGKETEKVTFDLLRKFPNGLRNFSKLFYSVDTELDLISKDEGNLYYIGKTANFWCRLINRRGDYNVYVTACVKP